MAQQGVRFLFLALLLHGVLAIADEQKRPTVCLNMIVKNESPVIERCLASVRPLIDTWVIVDTGSTDGTQEIIRSYFEDIPGKLYERPWVNFAHNRNEALALGKKEADYLLFIDADDILVFEEGFERPLLDKDAYYLNVNHGGTIHSRPHLVKSSLDWRWEGVLHEAISSTQAFLWETLQGVYMKILNGGDRSRDPSKFLKDALVIEAALVENPGDHRNTFYLAQSYRDAGLHELAIKNYEKRVEMGGWDQEVFWSLYQIGLLHEQAGHKCKKAEKAYLRAYHYRPMRAEPLYRLAQLYRKQEEFLLAYLIAQHGLSIKRSNDILFVDSWIYEYGILFEFSIAAYWVGQYEESLRACIELLAKENLPDQIREAVERNLAFATEKIAQKAV